MLWRCPACRTEIQHSSTESLPDPTDGYRCHVCRLDLRFDPSQNRMVVPPVGPPVSRALRLPLPFTVKRKRRKYAQKQ